MLAVNGPLPLITRTGLHPTAKLHAAPPNLPVRSFATIADKLSATITAAATSGDYDVPDSGVEVFNQLSLGSCVLESTTRQMAVALYLEQLKITYLSRLFGYYLCSKVQGTLGQDVGTSVSLAVDRYGRIGVCDESIWPYTDDLSTFYLPPPNALEAVLEGSDNRPTAYAMIDCDDSQTKLAQMEIAIRANHTVAFGIQVSNAIQGYQKGQILQLAPADQVVGGHSMQLTGVHYINGQRVWRACNSWGTSYGDGGYLLIADAAVADPSFSEPWVMSRMRSLLF